MGYYKYIKKAWMNPKKNPFYKQRLIEWRREEAITRIEKPTRIDRARSLGYKAKQGFVISRIRLIRGGKSRTRPKKGRSSRKQYKRLVLSKNYKWLAEERISKRYPNLEILNSYWVGKDGRYAWYEVILVDPYHNAIGNDKEISWICSRKHTRRVFRGLTSAGKKSRGLRKKGQGAEKIRPGLKANKRLH